jgi:D-arabinose 1-dehydrogenase-like Zn-dependent alcohol dehydrogenase
VQGDLRVYRLRGSFVSVLLWGGRSLTFVAETPLSTYRAAVVHQFHEPLTVEDVAHPELEAGQVRVKVEASGLCHTDIHAAHGDWPVKPSPPFIPGHEGVGIVTELGPGVSEVAVGDRVAMPWLGYACGTCDNCVSGWETLCTEQKTWATRSTEAAANMRSRTPGM